MLDVPKAFRGALLMSWLFAVIIAFTDELLESGANFSGEHPFQGFVGGELDGVLRFGRTLLLSGHSGIFPCQKS